jgi:hypothetical protein
VGGLGLHEWHGLRSAELGWSHEGLGLGLTLECAVIGWLNLKWVRVGLEMKFLEIGWLEMKCALGLVGNLSGNFGWKILAGKFIWNVHLF